MITAINKGGNEWIVENNEGGSQQTVFLRETENTEQDAIDAAYPSPLTQVEIDAETQSHRRSAVTAERDRRLNAGTIVTVTGYGDIPVQGRATDQINLIALGDTARDLKAAGVTGAVIPFRDGDDVIHQLTPDQMAEAVQKGKQAASAIYAAAWALKDAATVPADFASDSYWP
jgi:hypothetical protein